MNFDILNEVENFHWCLEAYLNFNEKHKFHCESLRRLFDVQHKEFFSPM